MRGIFFLLVVAAAGVANNAKSDALGRIIVEASAALVEIEPSANDRADDRRVIALPSLEFAMTIEPLCAPEMHTESISISVADTRKTYSANDVDGKKMLAVVLTIPQWQISPLTVEEFCLSEERDDNAVGVLRIHDAFTAHLSLRCAGDNSRSIVYASQSLDLDLQCQSGDDDSGASSNQDSSSPSALR